MAYKFPGVNPMAGAVPGRKAIDLYNWLEDNLGVAITDVQAAIYQSLCLLMGSTGDWYFRSGGGASVVATNPASMSVTLKAGIGFLDMVPLNVPADLTSPPFKAPVSSPRIDVLCVNPMDKSILVISGHEAAVPSAPDVTGDYCPVAHIYHRVGETSIKNKADDDGVNGYITLLYAGGIKVFADGDSTPSVAGGTAFDTPYSVAVPYSITMFDDGYAGQEITIVGRNAGCTIVDGGNLKLSGNWTATAYNTLRLYFGGSNWMEICRSNNA